jgi:DNA-binding IclR family transcriptional regulator
MTLNGATRVEGGPADSPVPERPYRIQSIERAVAILGAFTADEPELGVTEISERLSLHKSTVHRFLINLEGAGLLERNAKTGRYRLGLRLFELGGLVLQQMNLWDEALPFLEQLVRDSGETGQLAVLDQGEAIYIERVEARRALRVPAAMGRGYPAHATSHGKLLLAYQPPESVREIVRQRGLDRYTQNTITEDWALEQELARIRTQGYAVDSEEYEEGLRCVGAAIFDHTGQAIAAIGIGGPVTRVTPARVDELAGLVMSAAKGLSKRMGAEQAGAFVHPQLRVRTTASTNQPTSDRPTASGSAAV